MKRLFFALSGISLMVASLGCCCGASQCCGYSNPCGGGGGCPNGACGVGGPVYQQGAALPGTAVHASIPTTTTTSVATAPVTYQAQYPMTAMVEQLPTY